MQDSERTILLSDDYGRQSMNHVSDRSKSHPLRDEGWEIQEFPNTGCERHHLHLLLCAGPALLLWCASLHYILMNTK